MKNPIIPPYSDPAYLTHSANAYYRESHFKLQRELRQYVDVSITPFCQEWESIGLIPDDVIARHSALGYTSVSIYPLATEYLDGQRLPADIDPGEWDGFHDLIFIDEIARCGYLGVIWGLSCGNSIGIPPLVNFGTTEQKEAFLPDALHGRTRFCLGVTEPDVGSDVAQLKTAAKRMGDHYIVNGAKKWITNGIYADFCMAAVRTGEEGAKGISTLIIPLKVKGVSCRRMHNSGVHASGSTFIEFDDVKVPIENLIGEENDGFRIIMSNFNHERLWLACTSLRLARVCAADAYMHAISRETFGKKLIDNQVIRSKFSSFGRYIEPTYSWMEQLIYQQETSKRSKSVPEISGSIANLKVLAGRTLEHVSREAQQILGGLGYSKTGKGSRIEQISRDVRVMVVGGGSEEILIDLSIKQEIRNIAQLEDAEKVPLKASL